MVVTASPWAAPIEYQNSPGTFLPNYNGTLTFQDFNSMLQGNGSLALTDGNPVIPFRENDVALYFQDDWKIRPDLTLNLGLRWEFFGQAVNVLHNETVARQTGSDPLWDTSLPLSVTTFQKVPNRWKNYQPRIGFAWNPGHSRLVVRGGYAINFDPAFYNIYENSAFQPRWQMPVRSRAAADISACRLPAQPARRCARRTLPHSRSAATHVLTLKGPFLPNFRNPYTQTYSLGVQYGIGNAAVVEVRYVGNHTAALFQALDGNPTLEPLASAFPSYVSPSSLCQDPTAPGYQTLNCNVGALAGCRWATRLSRSTTAFRQM